MTTSRYRYAQIDANGVASAVSDLTGEVSAPNMIPIVPGDEVLGMQWTGVAWEAVPPPVANTNMVTVLALRSRFTTAEKVAIYTAAESSVLVRIWLDDLASVQDGLTDLNDPRTVEGVQGLEAAGLIGPGRAAEILS